MTRDSSANASDVTPGIDVASSLQMSTRLPAVIAWCADAVKTSLASPQEKMGRNQKVRKSGLGMKEPTISVSATSFESLMGASV